MGPLSLRRRVRAKSTRRQAFSSQFRRRRMERASSITAVFHRRTRRRRGASKRDFRRGAAHAARHLQFDFSLTSHLPRA